MKSFILFFILILICSCSKNKNNEPYFSFHIPYSPQSFDPLLQKGLSSRFLLNTLYRPLLKWDQENKLVANAAKKCSWIKNEFICFLKDIYFQDGTKLEAKHFKYTYQMMLEQNHAFLDVLKDVEINFNLKDKISFKSKKGNSQFTNQLADIAFSARKEKKLYKDHKSLVSLTEYKIAEFKLNQYLILSSKKNPKVKIYFLEDQSTAYRLYQNGQLDLLRNLPRSYFKDFQASKNLSFYNVFRMDSIVFSNEVLNSKNMRIALSHSLNFQELKTLYESKGWPGCPAISKKSYLNDYCLNFDLDKAKLHFSEVPEALRNKKLKLSFSVAGGEDILKGMEWMAYQWKKNLGLKIELNPLEPGVYLEKVKSKKYDILRKGISLDSVSCYEALSFFETKNVNNFIQLNNESYNQILIKMRSLRHNSPFNQKLCDDGLKILHDDYAYIPLGEMYFAYLSNLKYKDWYINALDILDIEDLKAN